MGGSGDGWLAPLGLGILGALALTGLVGAIVLANNHNDVPAWLSQAIGGSITGIGSVVTLLVAQRRPANGNGNGQASAETRGVKSA